MLFHPCLHQLMHFPHRHFLPSSLIAHVSLDLIISVSQILRLQQNRYQRVTASTARALRSFESISRVPRNRAGRAGWLICFFTLRWAEEFI
jgi:hypothetical protein